MKILYISPYAPTPIRTRSYNLVRVLARRDHIITLATVWENDSERRELGGFGQLGVRVLSARLSRPRAILNILAALPTRAPLQSAYSWQPNLESMLARVPFEYDLVHVEHLRGARYGFVLKSWLASHHLQVPIIWDSVDCISYLFEQMIAASRTRFGSWVAPFELGRTRRYESFAVGHFNRTLVTSATDQSELGRIASCHRNPITVVPNGVDLDYFAPPEISRESNVVVLTGKMSYHANATAAIHLANEIMPLVWSARPDARLWVVGANPSQEVRHLVHSPSTQDSFGPSNPITVAGPVPDIRPYLGRATLAVAPILYGTGIQNKVLEAMAMGTPVIATPQAVRDLQVSDGENILIAHDRESFAQKMILLLNEPALRKRIGLAGRKYVESHHDWNEMAGRLEKIYEEEISKTDAQV